MRTVSARGEETTAVLIQNMINFLLMMMNQYVSSAFVSSISENLIHIFQLVNNDIKCPIRSSRSQIYKTDSFNDRNITVFRYSIDIMTFMILIKCQLYFLCPLLFELIFII